MTESRESTLEERYGRTQKRRVDKRIAWIVIGLLLALGLAVLVFGNWRTNNQVEFRDLAYSIVDDRSATIDFEVSANPGETLACSLEALSDSFGQVGWKVVEFEASEDRTRRFSGTLITTGRATTTTVKNCWIE